MESDKRRHSPPSLSQHTTPDYSKPEKLLSLKEAAEQLGLPYFKLQRAARAGLVPTYSVYNSRRLVRLSELLAVIDGSRQGGKE